jgi:ribosomal biogenesis protein LAS1
LNASKNGNLYSLVLWLVTNIKEIKDSGCIGLVHEIGVLSSDRNVVQCSCPAKLLQKLSLSTIGERCLIDAALLLFEMASNNVKEKLRKLLMLSLGKLARISILTESSKEIESADRATEKLEMFKSQLKQKDVCLAENGNGGSLNTILLEKRSRWSITKSWTPCAIGMVPCSFSSTAVLPTLDVIDHELKDDTLEQHVNFELDDHTERAGYHSHPEKQLDVECIPAISEREISDMSEVTFPLKV